VLPVIFYLDNRPATALIPGSQGRVDESLLSSANRRSHRRIEQRAAQPLTSGRLVHVQASTNSERARPVSNKRANATTPPRAAYRQGHQCCRTIRRLNSRDLRAWNENAASGHSSSSQPATTSTCSEASTNRTISCAAVKSAQCSAVLLRPHGEPMSGPSLELVVALAFELEEAEAMAEGSCSSARRPYAC